MTSPRRYGRSIDDLDRNDKDGPWILAEDYCRMKADYDRLLRVVASQAVDFRVEEYERRAKLAEGAAVGLRNQIEDLKIQLSANAESMRKIQDKFEIAKEKLKALRKCLEE